MPKAKKIFLTGGNGFIGSYLSCALVEAGHEVTALLRESSTPHPDRPALPDSVRLVRGDITIPATYARFLSGHDVLLHAAADYRIGLPPLSRIRRSMYAANAAAALEIAQRAAEAGIGRIVYTSTTAALGETHGIPGDEQHKHNGVFRSYYEESKHIAHRLLEREQSAGLPVTLAILGGVFGKGDASALAMAIKDFIAGKLPVQVKCASRFQLCHVGRVCQGLMQLIDTAVPEHAYIFAGQDYSMPEIFALAGKIAHKPAPKKIAPRVLLPVAHLLDSLSVFGLHFPLSVESLNIMDGSAYVYSSNKAARQFGWDAGNVEADLEKYITELIE